jgi:predicted RNA-binding Zn-ribbon protein involved in translation (DUF1610 family)
MKKYYMSCPNCGIRMRRTGEKAEEEYGCYRREYECPNCGRFWIYSEYRNLIIPGRFKNWKVQ